MIRSSLLRAACVLAFVALGAAVTHAETLVEVPKSKATLTLGDGWNRVTHTHKNIVEIFKHDTGALLVLTRADVPNPDAWVADKKQAYADQVEKGIKASVRGYKRLAKKLGDANGVPALDVEAKRDDGAIIVVRVLLFRTYAVSVAIEMPKGADLALARTAVKTFTPPKEPTTVPPQPPKKS